MRFAELYPHMTRIVLASPVDIECREMPVAYEMIADQSCIDIEFNSVSVFSCPHHRVVPIKFVLAELCYMLSGRNDAESIVSYNAAMKHYVDADGKINGAYGYRMQHQLAVAIDRILRDIHTRQACVSIYNEDDGKTTTRTHLPCNTLLQFMYRNRKLFLIVTSRSSDFVTGYSIDALHWQALAILMKNQLVDAGMEIDAIEIVYNISSLHIYESDVEEVHDWGLVKTEEEQSEHFIEFKTLTLRDAMMRAKQMFRGGLSTVELGNVLCLDTISMHKVMAMEELFVTHRNKIMR